MGVVYFRKSGVISMVLMCKNKPVYDIDKEVVYNEKLLPGYMMKNPCRTSFKIWFKLRYSSNTNSLARKLKGVTFGQGNRVLINEKTYALSLSDCYWVKDENCPSDFEAVSPYYNDFWKGEGVYDINRGGAIPTLYTGGFLSKEWISAKYLCKYDKDAGIEEDVSVLCKVCGVSACNVKRISGGVMAENFTNTDLMLEQADESGLIDPDDFNEGDIIRLLGLQGAQMLTIDAITGNGDRHAGNFGWLRDTNTGEYVSVAPLYDFDHALDSRAVYDRLISDAVAEIKKSDYFSEALRICSTVSVLETNEIFKLRANKISELLNKV